MKISEAINQARNLAKNIKDENVTVERANAINRSIREQTRLLTLGYRIAYDQGLMKNGDNVVPDVEFDGVE